MFGRVNFLKLLYRSITPIELPVFLGVLCALCGVLIFGLPLLMPSAYTFVIFLNLYLPAYFLILLLCRTEKYGTFLGPIYILRSWLAFLVGCYLCILFKHWSHLTNSEYYDDIYHQIDQWLSPLLYYEYQLNQWLGIRISISDYVNLFRLIFCVGFTVCAFGGMRIFYALATAHTLNLLLGGLLYNAAPALGPFIYWSPEEWPPLMHLYMETTSAFRDSGGSIYDPNKLLLSLGAMPSFHLSLPIIFAWYMWKVHRAFSVFAILMCVYFFVHAKLTGFHYYVDLFASMLIAGGCIFIAEKMVVLFVKKGAPCGAPPSVSN